MDRSGRVNPVLAVLVALAIGLCTYLTFAGALENEFISLDTADYVVRNEHIRSFSAENVRWMFLEAHSSNWHPLTWMSHALDYSWYGLAPRGHHLTSVLIHALNAALACLLFLLIGLRIPSLRNRALLGAGISALLYAVHPQRVESVAWVAERKDVLCQLFSLVTLIFYLLAADKGRQRWTWLSASLLAFALALLSKPMAVTLPVVMLILDVYPLGRIEVTPALRLRTGFRPVIPILAEKLPFFLLTAASILLAIWAQGSEGSIVSLAAIDFGTRVSNALVALPFYFSKMLAPVNLSFFYEVPPIEALRGWAGALIAAAVLLGVSVHAIRAFGKGSRHWLVALLYLLVAISPVIGIIFVGRAGAADRYTYMPTMPYFAVIGFWIAGGLVGGSGGRRTLLRAGAAGATLLLAATLSYLSFDRVKDWRSDFTIWKAAVEANPNSYESLIHLGLARKKNGDIAGSIRDFERALLLESPEKQLATVRKYQRSRIVSMYGVLFYELADSRSLANDLDGAIRDFRSILENNIAVQHSRAMVFYRLADLHLRKGEPALAERALARTFQLEPDFRDSLRLRRALSNRPR
ncbi:MAG: hypothetical protein V2A76_08855 [Planctomycetota bacterium]